MSRSASWMAVAALLLAAAAGEAQLAGKEIIERVNSRPRGETSRMRLAMVLHDAKRGDFHKTIDLRRKRFPNGYRTAYRILDPHHEEGIGLLLAEDRGASDMWMYFPKSDHLVHVASRGLSALASDFSCEDLLVTVPLADYRFRYLGRAACGDRSCLKVEMKPASEALAREFGFDRSVGLIRDDIWMIVHADYFTASGQLFKTFRAEKTANVDGVWTILRYSMVNHRADHSTVVTVEDVDYAADLSADEMSEEGLR